MNQRTLLRSVLQVSSYYRTLMFQYAMCLQQTLVDSMMDNFCDVPRASNVPFSLSIVPPTSRPHLTLCSGLFCKIHDFFCVVLFCRNLKPNYGGHYQAWRSRRVRSPEDHLRDTCVWYFRVFYRLRNLSLVVCVSQCLILFDSSARCCVVHVVHKLILCFYIMIV